MLTLNNSTTGALRGLESLCHLASTQSIPLPLTLRDAPRFPYRSLMVDAARHFLPVDKLKRMIDGMSTTKLNMLHVHLSDIEAFPVHSESVPALNKGAYGGGKHPELIYSHADIAELVRHGQMRGVRIMVHQDQSCSHEFLK